MLHPIHDKFGSLGEVRHSKKLLLPQCCVFAVIPMSLVTIIRIVGIVLIFTKFKSDFLMAAIQTRYLLTTFENKNSSIFNMLLQKKKRVAKIAN